MKSKIAIILSYSMLYGQIFSPLASMAESTAEVTPTPASTQSGEPGVITIEEIRAQREKRDRETAQAIREVMDLFYAAYDLQNVEWIQGNIDTSRSNANLVMKKTEAMNAASGLVDEVGTKYDSAVSSDRGLTEAQIKARGEELAKCDSDLQTCQSSCESAPEPEKCPTDCSVQRALCRSTIIEKYQNNKAANAAKQEANAVSDQIEASYESVYAAHQAAEDMIKNQEGFGSEYNRRASKSIELAKEVRRRAFALLGVSSDNFTLSTEAINRLLPDGSERDGSTVMKDHVRFTAMTTAGAKDLVKKNQQNQEEVCKKIREVDSVAYYLFSAASAIAVLIKVNQTGDYSAIVDAISIMEPDPDNLHDEQVRHMARAYYMQEEIEHYLKSETKSKDIILDLYTAVYLVADKELQAKLERIKGAEKNLTRAQARLRQAIKKVKKLKKVVSLWKIIMIGCCAAINPVCCPMASMQYSKHSGRLSKARREKKAASADVSRAKAWLALSKLHTHMRCDKPPESSKATTHQDAAGQGMKEDSAVYNLFQDERKFAAQIITGHHSSFTVDPERIEPGKEVDPEEEDSALGFPIPETRKKYLEYVLALNDEVFVQDGNQIATAEERTSRLQKLLIKTQNRMISKKDVKAIEVSNPEATVQKAVSGGFSQIKFKGGSSSAALASAYQAKSGDSVGDGSYDVTAGDLSAGDINAPGTSAAAKLREYADKKGKEISAQAGSELEKSKAEGTRLLNLVRAAHTKKGQSDLGDSALSGDGNSFPSGLGSYDVLDNDANSKKTDASKDGLSKAAQDVIDRRHSSDPRGKLGKLSGSYQRKFKGGGSTNFSGPGAEDGTLGGKGEINLGISEQEREDILKGALKDKKNYTSDDQDTLWTKVTNAYIRLAYPILLKRKKDN